MATKRSPHDIISDRICEIQASWKLWKQLFESNESRELMFLALGPMWRTVRSSIVDGVILGVARLVDRRKDVLSFKSLVKSLPQQHTNPDACSDLESRLESLRHDVDAVLDHRDKRIAHSSKAIVSDPTSLLPLSIGEIDQVVSSVTEFMHAIDAVANRKQMLFEEIEIGAAGDGLLLRIEIAKQLDVLALQVKTGQLSGDEVKQRVTEIAR